MAGGDLLALFEAGTEPELLLHALEAWDGRIDLSSAEFRDRRGPGLGTRVDGPVPADAFGRRTWIVPWNMEAPAEAADAVIVRLDPGLAFGSGTHPTTALCLQWLDSLDLRGKTVLDFGCGSGILALAALKLGAERAVGVDNDPQALVGDRRQRAAQRGRRAHDRASPGGRAGGALSGGASPTSWRSRSTQLADTLAARVEPGGVIALSGILHGQEESLAAALWRLVRRTAVATRLEDWMRITGRRRD